LNTFNGKEWKGQNIQITHFASHGERLPSSKRNLYVKHLPKLGSEKELETELKKVFDPFGEIEALLLKKAETQDGKYFAFICYK